MFRASVTVGAILLAGTAIGCSDQNTGNSSSNSPPPLVQSAIVTAPAVVPASVPKARPNAAVTEVPLEDDNGTFVVPVTINDAIALKFTIDSGASDVTIPSDVASTLVRAGTISEGDYIGSGTAVLADGSEIPSPEFKIRSLRVGGLVLHDVTATITGDRGSLLLGQSFLTRLQNWSIDNKRHVLILNPERSSVIAEDDASQRDVRVGDGTPAAAAAGSAADILGTSAANTVLRYFSAWSNAADPDGQSVREFYGDEVDYYGKQLGLADVMEQKTQFARRWPLRSYTLRGGSVQTQCSDQTRACKVVGLVDWRAGSDARSRYSSGTAKFALVLRNGLIVSEHSRVISRN